MLERFNLLPGASFTCVQWVCHVHEGCCLDVEHFTYSTHFSKQCFGVFFIFPQCYHEQNYKWPVLPPVCLVTRCIVIKLWCSSSKNQIRFPSDCKYFMLHLSKGRILCKLTGSSLFVFCFVRKETRRTSGNTLSIPEPVALKIGELLSTVIW